jgi:hypothetical protein
VAWQQQKRAVSITRYGEAEVSPQKMTGEKLSAVAFLRLRAGSHPNQPGEKIGKSEAAPQGWQSGSQNMERAAARICIIAGG